MSEDYDNRGKSRSWINQISAVRSQLTELLDKYDYTPTSQQGEDQQRDKIDSWLRDIQRDIDNLRNNLR